MTVVEWNYFFKCRCCDQADYEGSSMQKEGRWEETKRGRAKRNHSTAVSLNEADSFILVNTPNNLLTLLLAWKQCNLGTRNSISCACVIRNSWSFSVVDTAVGPQSKVWTSQAREQVSPQRQQSTLQSFVSFWLILIILGKT